MHNLRLLKLPSNKRILGCRPGVIRGLLDKIFKDDLSVVAYEEDRLREEATEKESSGFYDIIIRNIWVNSGLKPLNWGFSPNSKSSG